MAPFFYCKTIARNYYLYDWDFRRLVYVCTTAFIDLVILQKFYSGKTGETRLPAGQKSETFQTVVVACGVCLLDVLLDHDDGGPFLLDQLKLCNLNQWIWHIALH